MPVQRGLFYTVSEGGNRSAPPLVLIHGAGANGQFWPSEISRMPGCTVYCLDLPGHGNSPGAGQYSVFTYAHLVSEWMEALELPPALLVGYSMGGAVALAMALEYSRQVAALVLISSGPILDVPNDLFDFSANPVTLPVAVESLVERSFGKSTPAHLVELTVKRLQQTGAGVLYNDLLACAAFDVRGQLGQIRQPVLIASGSEDTFTSPAYAGLLAARLPDARLRLFYGAGHLLMLEQPTTLMNTLQAFMEEIYVGVR